MEVADSLTIRVSALTEILSKNIAAYGPVSFRDFMARALYDAEHGYYPAGRAAIGRGGDFFTNVSVGALFGRLMARQFVQVWERLGGPTRWTIVEQGAHRGQFAADVLRGLAEFAPEAYSALEYVIVEPFARMIAEQRRALSAERVGWVSGADELTLFVGVHFSNELLDAFPVHLVVKRESGWIERHVDWRDGRFVFVDGALTDPRLDDRLAVIDAPTGFITEINLAALDWIESLAAKIERGCVLAIDYGYERAEFLERQSGTLSAYAAHAREPDPLVRPGEIDLTAHVEFTSLIEHAERVGFRLHGFTDQHRFMVGASRLHFHDGETAASDVRAFKTLMHPEFLGGAFKAVCFEKGGLAPGGLAGFEFARGCLAV